MSSLKEKGRLERPPLATLRSTGALLFNRLPQRPRRIAHQAPSKGGFLIAISTTPRKDVIARDIDFSEVIEERHRTFEGCWLDSRELHRRRI
jgi:hypothetical protein